jgi:ABC-type dipeptide/oligopeptide/nickel transport system ATPase component
MSTLLNPELIIADEPTSALDVISQRTVLQIISEVRKNLSASMIMIGHDMALQAQIADRMGIMFEGYFVEVGSVEDIFEHPLHPYTKGLIQSIPSIRKKQDIHTLASCELTEAQRRAFAEYKPLSEASPGHYVVDFS